MKKNKKQWNCLKNENSAYITGIFCLFLLVAIGKRCPYEAPKKCNSHYHQNQLNGCYIYKILGVCIPAVFSETGGRGPGAGGRGPGAGDRGPGLGDGR